MPVSQFFVNGANMLCPRALESAGAVIFEDPSRFNTVTSLVDTYVFRSAGRLPAFLSKANARSEWPVQIR